MIVIPARDTYASGTPSLCMKNLVVAILLLGLLLVAVKDLLLPVLVFGSIALLVFVIISVLKVPAQPRLPQSPPGSGKTDPQFKVRLTWRQPPTPSRSRALPATRTRTAPQARNARPQRRDTEARSPEAVQVRGAYRPFPALVRILSMAYRCKNFSGPCRGMRWDPKAGHIPRGYCGATGTASDVKLVLVVAEPGDPQPGDHETMDEALQRTVWAFREGPGLFHRNARKLLGYCWPGLGFDQQLRRVWITESVLCSAAVTTGPVPREVEQACGEDYLAPQLALFPRALVVALGGKAHQRLKRLGIPHEEAHALAPPGCNQAGADPSWRRIGDLVRRLA